MRARLALIAALALCVTPVMAQGKAKTPVVAPSVQVLEICESFANNKPDAVEAAIAKGWDASDQGGESPFITSYGGSKEFVGFGYADIFVLVESYPDRTFGYCRADVLEPAGNGQAQVEAIVDLGRYTGDVVTNDDGTFASLGDTDGERAAMLLTHSTPDAFVLQLSITTPKAAAADGQSTGAEPPAGETAPSAQTTEEK